jgi:hypothetical protein
MKLRRTALLLWTLLAVVVWNVIFDRVVVLAGRRYVYSATLAAWDGGAFLSARDWMGRAVSDGVWIASAGAVAILVVGLGLIAVAGKPRTGR